MDQDKQAASSLKKKIDALVNAPAQIDAEISSLKIKEHQLLEELAEVRSAIPREEKKVTNFPDTITKMKENLVSKIQNVKPTHRLLHSIPGTMEVDEAMINDFDQIRLRALHMIENKLWPM